MKGEAEAFAIEAKASAEAEQMAKKADAWKEYREAAVVDMVLETMPKVQRWVPPPPPNPNKIQKDENGVLFSNDIGILGKRNSEFSQQESNLRPSDY